MYAISICRKSSSSAVQGLTLTEKTTVIITLATTFPVVGSDREPADKWPLGRCEGDCDSDDDFQGTLICEQRKWSQSWAEVPGYNGTGRRGTDHCRLAGATPNPTPPVSLHYHSIIFHYIYCIVESFNGRY